MPSLTIAQAHDLALSHHRAGQLAEAESIYRQILAIAPDHAPTLSMLGMLARQQGRLNDSLELTTRAAALDPGSALPHFNHAQSLAAAGMIEPAIESYRRVVSLQPDQFEAHNNLGNLLRTSGALREAADSLRRAVALRPDLAQPQFNLGNTLADIGLTEEAAVAFARTIELQQDHAEAHLNLGNIDRLGGRLPEAAEHYRRAIAARPDYAEAHWSLGLIHLQEGDYSHGWREFEARLAVKGFPVRVYNKPIWDGADLNGRRILLHSEGGFGDTLQFVRYAKLVRERRGGRVLIQCMPELKRLLTGNCGIELVIGDDETPPEFDVHCPLLSLPLRFDTTLESIPVDVPYLQADPTIAERWCEKLGARNGKKIGLVWAGSAKHLNDANRSISLNLLAPLAHGPNIRLISLQKHRLDRPESQTPAGLETESYSDDLHDFADTAALISQLDLVIGVDTAIVHLAGALGKATWVLLSEPAEWRWLLNRTDSPWYPTMRLFRQPRAGDWAAAIAELVKALRVSFE